MRKFKLIKTYPGSLALDSTIESLPMNYSQYELYPEFWEEIYELEVPIGTTFKAVNGLIYKIESIENNKVQISGSNKGHIFSNSIIDVNYYFKNKTWVKYEPKTYEVVSMQSNSIQSVKRLSDGVIFTIDDKVKNPKFQSNQTFKITKFELDCNKIHMLANGIGIHKIEPCEIKVITKDGVKLYVGDTLYSVNNNFIIESIVYDSTSSKMDGYVDFSTEKAAQKYFDSLFLFTTHDGVKMKKSDEYWYVQTGEYNGNQGKLNVYPWEVKHYSTGTLDLTSTNIKRFSTEENAEEYVRLNKKQYSLQDILNTVEPIDLTGIKYSSKTHKIINLSVLANGNR